MAKSARTNPHPLAQIVGWYGTIAIISAYALVSFDIITPNSLMFILLNLTGAIGIIIISVIKGLRQTIVLNIFWLLIAVVALIRIVLST
jgi:hypothetical protein